jgi:hypothetical protein
MALGGCKLNNRYMRNIRREDIYQAIIIDLTMLGIVSKEECEMLINGSIPENITLPNNTRGALKEDTKPPVDYGLGDEDSGNTDTDTDADTDTNGVDNE